VVFTNREKLIGAVVGVAVLLAVGDYYGLEPYLQAKEKLRVDLATAEDKLADQTMMVRRQAAAPKEWERLQAEMKQDLYAGQNQVVEAIQVWAREARCKMDIRPDKMARVGDFLPIRLVLRGEGTSAGVGSLLYRIEEAATKRNFPIRIMDVNLSPVKEGTDDLQFTLDVESVVYSEVKATTKPKAKN
jgi:hypothetical protein